MWQIANLKVKIFADGAAIDSISEFAQAPFISGFTTNPTLMRQASVSNYREFADRVLPLIGDKPISFEVIADTESEMESQARTIAAWSDNIYIKIPITNTSGVFLGSLIESLSADGIKLNVTALTSVPQVSAAAECLCANTPSIISVMAGRVADTGTDPVEVMKQAIEVVGVKPSIELLWASTRELYNLIQADSIGCHIVTMTPSLLGKLPLIGKELNEYSLETVKMFYNDALEAKLSII